LRGCGSLLACAGWGVLAAHAPPRSSGGAAIGAPRATAVTRAAGAGYDDRARGSAGPRLALRRFAANQSFARNGCSVLAVANTEHGTADDRLRRVPAARQALVVAALGDRPDPLRDPRPGVAVVVA